MDIAHMNGVEKVGLFSTFINQDHNQRTSHINNICHHFFSTYAVRRKFIFLFSLFLLLYRCMDFQRLRSHFTWPLVIHKFVLCTYLSLYNFSSSQSSIVFFSIFFLFDHKLYKIIVNKFVVVNIACLIRLNWMTSLDVLCVNL